MQTANLAKIFGQHLSPTCGHILGISHHIPKLLLLVFELICRRFWHICSDQAPHSQMVIEVVEENTMRLFAIETGQTTLLLIKVQGLGHGEVNNEANIRLEYALAKC